MITKSNLRKCLQNMGFSASSDNMLYTKVYPQYNKIAAHVDFQQERLIYPCPIKVNDNTTSNFEHDENFVVFECVIRLLDKGYRPEHIELEPRWNLGHESKGGKGDILVKNENGEKTLFIIECKTFGQKYAEALKELQYDGGQLFSYWQQEKSTEWLSLYCSDLKDEQVIYLDNIIHCVDDANIVKTANKDNAILLYKDSFTVPDLFKTWQETYGGQLSKGLIFSEDTQAYKIGQKPIRKKDLKDFTPSDHIENRFEEILRHNNVSDKENAFNRLVALFICKLVDEIRKDDCDEMDFQYKIGTDTYESLQDRLQRLHRDGMQDFMNEKINYIDDEYAKRLFAQHLHGEQRKAAIEDLQNTIRILKYYSNNDFSFKDVHNEELFYQNGKVLVEVVELFERYRIVYPNKHQFLGTLFEHLLNKGFKQNEGQFFTPTPLTRFIWDSIPLSKIMQVENGKKFPKIIDYACGAGHFLTEGVEAVNAYLKNCEGESLIAENLWTEHSIFGIEKDYRLARVAKVCLYMNGAGRGQIIFGDGLEQYKDKGIENGTFDILVANPPYSVKGFKSHLKLKNNDFTLLSRISNEANMIETLFVERIAQLLKPKGIAAVILPNGILNNTTSAEIGAREQILQNFHIRSIVELGDKTFSDTGKSTYILFLEKYEEPPQKKELINDIVDSIVSANVAESWEDDKVLNEFVKTIQVSKDDYLKCMQKELDFGELKEINYFKPYVIEFEHSNELKNLKNQKNFKNLSLEEQTKKILNIFYSGLLKVEREKLYYFALIYEQTTLVITAPSSVKEQKEFLGYEWSTRTGQEGLHQILPGGMLYNETNREASGTLAASIRKSFDGIIQVPTDRAQDVNQIYTFMSLKDMIDFTKTSFTKAINTVQKHQIKIDSRYPLIPLGGEEGVCNIKIGGTPSRKNHSYFKGDLLWVCISEMNGQVITDTKEKLTTEAVASSNVKLIKQGTTLLSFKLSIGKTAIAGKDLYTNEAIAALEPKDKDKILDKFIFYVFNGKVIDLQNVNKKAFGKTLNKEFLEKDVQIPVPPIDIQKQIVLECEAVDEEYNTSRMSIEEYEKKIAKVFADLEIISSQMGGGKTK